MEEFEPEDEEAELVRRSQQGDLEAQSELIQRHIPGMTAWIRLKRSDLVRQREETMDLVQSVFALAIRDIHHFEYRGRNSFRNWVLTYAINKLKNRHQFWDAERRTPRRENDVALSKIYESITPSRVASNQEFIDSFEASFAKLSDTDQDMILLAKIDRLSHAEIAKQLGTTEAASRKALQRAIVRLASLMQQPE